MLFYLGHFLCIVNLRWYVFWYYSPTPHKYEPAFVPFGVLNVRLVIVQVIEDIAEEVIGVIFLQNISGTLAPFGLRGCKNGPAPFPGRMSYKATKPGLASVLYLSIHYMVLLFIRAPFYVLLVFIAMCAVFW